MRTNKKIMLTICTISLLIAIGLTIWLMVFYNEKINAVGLQQTVTDNKYTYHYAFITEESENPFWQSIYKGARDAGSDYDAYVEDFSASLSDSYSLNELLEMAIAAKVDGIIMEGSDDAEISRLINLAMSEGINVVTVMEDCIISTRCSFIGVNNYKLGKEYANQIINFSEDETSKVVVLLDDVNTTNEDIMLTGLNETIKSTNGKIEIIPVFVDSEVMFSSEEIIRNLIKNTGEQPDMIVCLSLIDTLSAYQSVVDFNKVGEIKIIGYYTSDAVLEAVNKNIISAALVIDTIQLGESAVNSLYEYQTYGRVSDYVSVDINLLNVQNVDSYIDNQIEAEK